MASGLIELEIDQESYDKIYGQIQALAEMPTNFFPQGEIGKRILGNHT